MQESLNQNGPVWYFWEILKQPVLEPDGTSLGRVADLAAAVLEQDAPIKGLVVAGSHHNRRYLPWNLVERLELKAVRVHPGASKGLCDTLQPPGQILLGKGLLDRQIVDIEGAKVLRVNDLQLRQRNGQLILSKVDVGLKSLLRRVGLYRATAAILRWFLGYTLPDKFIAWRLVQPVGSSDILRLKFSQTRFSRLHPADLADIIEDLDRPEQARVFRALDIDMAADVLEETDPEVQVQLIQHLTTEMASDVLEQMSPSKAADLLQDLEDPHVEKLLNEMEPDAAQDVRSLLVHDEETAGGMMTTSFFSQPPHVTAGRALEALRQEAPDLDVVYYTYVTDKESHLLGALSLRDLLTMDSRQSLESVMVRRMVSAALDDNKSDIAELFAKYGLRALPVVDDEGRIQGVIRFKALLEVMAPHLGR
jgi:magnesium transporter